MNQTNLSLQETIIILLIIQTIQHHLTIMCQIITIIHHNEYSVGFALDLASVHNVMEKGLAIMVGDGIHVADVMGREDAIHAVVQDTADN